MNDVLTLQIQRQTFRMLMDGQVTFNQILKEHDVQDIVVDEILSRYSDAGGSPHLIDLKTNYSTTAFDLIKLIGSFETSYAIEFYFSCDDMTNVIKGNMTWSVNFNTDTLTFSFVGPEDWKLDN